MDIKIDNEVLEYNIIGGILDFYFLAGPTPANVASQYAEVVGLPAIPAYWGLGSHQCRYGYRDWIDVAEVVANYSAAAIPLETMWTDIDYMYNRWVFTLDPERFPLDKMRRIIDNLHKNDQKYIMMIDPAVAYQPYPSFERGVEKGIFLKEANGDIHKGVVWPGVTAFPDWFHPNATEYWTDEFARFFNANKGVNIDGSWIDMNEPANFCSYPCTDPEAEAIAQQMPPARLPVREPPRPIAGFPETETQQKSVKARSFGTAMEMLETRPKVTKRAAPKKDIISPPYAIKNDVAYGLSDRTVHTDIVHADGHLEYDVHNLYGTSMSTATYNAMLSRRPGKRPFIITRSTFAGAGHKVGKWLGDNLSTWHHYRNSISGVLQFNALYQIPLVGADVCGFGGNTTETLCARWTALGAFAPFFRNHNGDTSISQEPYRWPLAASAARKAIGIRYSLLDYLYTAMWRQSTTGVPSVSPLWFQYPQDKKVWGMDLQYLYGPSIVVAPVTVENSTSVDIYLPKDIWYDFNTHQPVKSGNQTINDVAFDEIPLFIRGGSILPVRKSQGAMTTAEVRKRDFELVIVPNAKGEASGELYLDDGESLVQQGTTHVEFSYKNGKLRSKGSYGYNAGVKITGVKVLGGKRMVKQAEVALGLDKDFSVDC
jgi:alpha-glucosidase